MGPLTRIQREARPESMLINMGPSHPAMHGTIRIMLELEAEKILNAEVEVGYLHRGFEKTCENKSFFNLLIYTDRLNYVSPLINNLGYAMTMEKMLGVAVPERAQLIRVLMSELSRVSDHLTCLAAMTMECGAFTVFLYMMKARESLWDAIEFTAGARMTTSYIRIGGVRADLHPDWRASVSTAIRETRRVLQDVSGLIDQNSIFLGRTRGVGVISKADALSFGWTGPCLRSTGIPYDVRKAHPYLVYDRLSFEVPVGEFGDNYDRYSVRMREMEQSLRLIEQVAVLLPDAPPLPAGPAIEPAEAVRGSRRQRTSGRIRLSPNLEGSEKERLDTACGRRVFRRKRIRTRPWKGSSATSCSSWAARASVRPKAMSISPSRAATGNSASTSSRTGPTGPTACISGRPVSTSSRRSNSSSKAASWPTSSRRSAR